jgi:predicted metal-binding protein
MPSIFSPFDSTHKKRFFEDQRCQRCDFNSDDVQHRKMPKNPTMMSTPSYSRRYSILSALLLLIPFAVSLSSSSPPKVRIQVCQNKDCCRRFQGSASLVDTLHDLIPPDMAAAHTTVESTSCLSRCDTGPNICIQRDGQPDNANIDLQGVENAAAAAMHLQTACAIDVPSKLIAAVQVMERAQKGM